MRYQQEAQGDWGQMEDHEGVKTATESLSMSDGTKLFVRSWVTGGTDVLLVLHGLGAHSGWFIDQGNELARRGVTVYAVDHRGFGRSEGHAGHIDAYQTYVEDSVAVIHEIRKRQPGARLYVLGHSMGGIFVTYIAAQHADLLAGVVFLNPWVADNSRLPLGTMLAIFGGGLFKSRRAWQVAGGHEVMTTNPEAIQMLEADPYWRRTQTASFLVQILRMRVGMLKQARLITIPALVIQAEADLSVVSAATRKLYETLASKDKTWKTYPGYGHDSELEADRTSLDDDLAAWMRAHASQTEQA